MVRGKGVSGRWRHFSTAPPPPSSSPTLQSSTRTPKCAQQLGTALSLESTHARRREGRLHTHTHRHVRAHSTDGTQRRLIGNRSAVRAGSSSLPPPDRNSCTAPAAKGPPLRWTHAEKIRTRLPLLPCRNRYTSPRAHASRPRRTCACASITRRRHRYHRGRCYPWGFRS